MSLRDFNSNDDRPISLQNEPLGNGSGLDAFHTVHPEASESVSTPKIVGAVAVALMIGVAGVALYAHSTASMQPKPVVTASNLPSPTLPAPVPAAAPAPQQQAAMTPDANTPAAASDNTPAPAPVKSAPVRSASIAHSNKTGSAASARMAADTNQSSVQPQHQAAVIPEPVSPTPSPSDVAANNTQSGTAVPQGATTASDMPTTTAAPATTTAQNNTTAPQQAQSSTPQASNTAPSQDQQTGATPAPAQAPAQSAGQVNQ
jgi:hypothetical protein